MLIQQLENQSIAIIREAYNRSKNVAILWTAGKKSTILLYLCRRAFFGSIPFKILYFKKDDYRFSEEKSFRDKVIHELKLDLAIVNIQEKIGKGAEVSQKDIMGIIDEVTKEEKLDAIIFPEEKNKYKNYTNKTYNIFTPLSNWTEIDIWQYIKTNNIPLNPLYFSKDGKRYKDSDQEGELSLIESAAENIDDIIVKNHEDGKIKKEAEGKRSEKDYILHRLKELGY